MNKKFTIIHDDETMTVSLDGEFVCEFNHDEDGWHGISKGEATIKRIAELLNIEVANIHEI